MSTLVLVRHCESSGPELDARRLRFERVWRAGEV
jgi:hypothetical protein